MSADEIEFFISDELPPEELSKQEEMGGAPRRRRPLDVDRDALVAVLLLAAAAALPTVATFQGVYTIRESGRGSQPSTFGADGWGRYHVSAGEGLSLIPAGVHEIRYGIPLVVCASVLAILGVGLLMTLVLRASGAARRRAFRIGIPIALTVAGALAGVVASMWLHVQSQFDTLHAEVGSFGAFGRRPRLDTSVGGCLWLSFAGVVAGLLAAGALWYSARAESGSEEDPGKLA